MYHTKMKNPRQKGSGLATPAQMAAVQAAAAAQASEKAEQSQSFLSAFTGGEDAMMRTAASDAQPAGVVPATTVGPAAAEAGGSSDDATTAPPPSPSGTGPALQQALGGDFFGVQSRSGSHSTSLGAHAAPSAYQ